MRTITGSVKLIPSAWTDDGSHNFTNRNVANAYTDTTSTTNNRMTLARSNNSAYVSSGYYTLTSSDLSNVPSVATITSVTLKVKYYASNTTYVTEVNIQFQSGTTNKGSSITSRTTSQQVYTATDSGTWTLAELQNARLHIQATHNRSTSNAYLYFYGAEIDVEYEYNEYDIAATVDKDATISPLSSSVIEGGSFTLTITPNTSNKRPTAVLDNNDDVSSSLVTSGTGFRYVLSNINADHTIEVIYSIVYDITWSTADPSLTLSETSPAKVSENDDWLIEITPSLPGVITITDNGSTSSINVSVNDVATGAAKIYTITNVVADHTLSFTFVEKTKYTATSTIDQDATLQPTGTNYVYEGEQYELIIVPDNMLDEPVSITDNGVDVKGQLIEIFTQNEINSTYTVETASGASYGFELNNDGYYESTNKGVNNSAAVCIVTFNLAVAQTINLYVINYAEATYDYGLIGELDDTPLSNSSSADSNVYWSGADDNSEDEQLIQFENVSAGTHTIYIKYFKDNYTSSNNDSLQFRIDTLVNSTEDIYQYKYIIQSVNEPHTISVIYYAIKHNVTASTNLNYITINPSGQIQVRDTGRYILKITSSQSGGVIVTDNNVQQQVIPVTPKQVNKTKQYIIDEVLEDHVITVTFRQLQNVQCTAQIDNTTIATVDPASEQLQEGSDLIVDIFNSDTTNHPVPLSVSDNYEDVTSSLNYVTPAGEETYLAEEYSTSGRFYNNTNQYAENPINISADDGIAGTRIRGYRSGSYNNYTYTAGIIEYTFDLSNIPNDANIVFIECKIYGRRNSNTSTNWNTDTSQYTAYAVLYSGNTMKGNVTQIPYDYYSNQIFTLSDTGSWTRQELDNLKLRFAAGYQGIYIGGISLVIEYICPSRWRYTVTSIASPHDVRVRYNPDFYTKISGTWVPSTIVKMHPKVNDEYKNVKKMFVKTNNQWRQINDI